MRFVFLLLLICSAAIAQSINYDARKPETKEEQQAFEEWNQEEEEARERAERERWLLEERARGYEPTSEDYRPVMPKKRSTPVQ